ncbi:hypothetical protein EDB87DRAFT_1630532, partial [Lactarius vividus]
MAFGIPNFSTLYVTARWRPKKPFDARFELHGNKRLTLLNIVRSHIPAAEFAFLSACHTVEL